MKKAEAAEQYQRWLEKHELEHNKKLQSIKHETPKDYWARQAREERRVIDARNAHNKNLVAKTPLPVPLGSTKPSGRLNPRADNYEELQARERAAQELIREKQARTAPVYNKGGAQYFTEEMAKDLQSGSLRRRS